MKIDIENILYILVIIVWIIVGFIKKNKKNRTVPAGEGRPSDSMPPIGDSQQPDFSEMLEELLGKKSARPEKTETIPAAPPVVKSKKTVAGSPDKTPSTLTLESIQGTDATQRSISYMSKFKRASTLKKEIKPSITSTAKTSSFAQKAAEEYPAAAPAFDLREAVIYSELLRPKFENEDRNY